MPSELGEDEIKIVVVAAAGADDRPRRAASSSSIPRMPRFMIPRYVEVVDALPKTDATFRTRKVELRDRRLTGSHLGPRGGRRGAAP